MLAGLRDVSRESVWYADAFVDGTGLLGYRLSGDPSVLDGPLDRRSDVLGYEVVADHDGSTVLYLHVDSGEPAGTLVELLSAYRLLVETPFAFTDEGLRVTLVGTAAALRGALGDLPSNVEWTVERHVPFAAVETDDGLLAGLTDRQRETLEAAVDVGYYDVPKSGDRADVAARLDCSASTVGKHLQKAERHIVTRLFESGS
nr:helix-turn-helix domain-containing protein [Halomarina rubra]